jgi:hypothetical protein
MPLFARVWRRRIESKLIMLALLKSARHNKACPLSCSVTRDARKCLQQCMKPEFLSSSSRLDFSFYLRVSVQSKSVSSVTVPSLARDDPSLLCLHPSLPLDCNLTSLWSLIVHYCQIKRGRHYCLEILLWKLTSEYNSDREFVPHPVLAEVHS